MILNDCGVSLGAMDGRENGREEGAWRRRNGGREIAREKMEIEWGFCKSFDSLNVVARLVV